MDQVAAFDADQFPPVAMLHDGKARFPVRIHADQKAKVAVLRSEFPMPAALMRPLSEAILGWGKEQGLGNILALDSLWLSGQQRDQDQIAHPSLVYSTLHERLRTSARDAGLEPFREGALAGVPAMLVLHSRLRAMPVVALLAVIASPDEDVDSAMTFADMLPRLVPGLHIDLDALRHELGHIQQAVRGVQEQARAMVRELQRAQSNESEGVETPAMYM